MALAFFLSLNFLIALWEIGLGLHIGKIEKENVALNKKYKTKKDHFTAVVDFFLSPLSVAECFSFSFWTKVWSTYSLYDPSYSNRQSFGFFVDVGNGWTTSLPTLLAIYTMTYEIPFSAPRIVGIVCLLKYYQEMYGTVLYFLSFILNERYKGRSTAEVALFIGLTNGLWFIFPILGIYASIRVIQEDSFDVYR